jgi:flagellar basal body rod protein FlgG
VDIGGDGTITQGGTDVARINLVNVPNKGQLRKVGQNLYATSAASLNSQSARNGVGELVQGHVEQSSVDAIHAMMDVQNAAYAVTTATRLMSVHDEMTGRLINSLGRVSA